MGIHDRIKMRRKELDLSADAVAEALGVSRATVYRYESSDIEKMPLDVLGPLSKVLKCTPAYLMGWEDLEFPNPYIYHLNSKRLQDEIEFNRLTIDELAERVGVIPVYMNSIVYESVSVDLETANKIADTLNVHLDDILDGISHSNIVRAPSPQFADIKDAITSLSTSELKELYLKIDNELDKREALDQYDESLQHEPTEDNKTSSDFKNILETYIESDDLTKAMVRRTLGIE